jgi:hypothetical protein
VNIQSTDNPEMWKNKIGNYFANKNAHFVCAVPKVVLQEIKNKTRQTLGFGAYAGNEGMGGQ